MSVKDLNIIRQEIDQVDQELVALLGKTYGSSDSSSNL